MDLRRPDRSGVRGLRIATGGGNIIEDIHRQQRRRLLVRAGQLVALALVLLALGIGFKLFADRRERTSALDNAHQDFVHGTAADVGLAIDRLERSLQRDPDHQVTLETLALVRAHQWLEFGEGEFEARAALEGLAPASPRVALANAALSFGEGNVDAAQALIDDTDPEGDWVAEERAWLHALVTAANHPDDDERTQAALDSLAAVLVEYPTSIAHRRVRSLLLLLRGQHDEALAELEDARDQSPSHLGLAADETLYNAFMHRELGGVASVADQLLAVHGEADEPSGAAAISGLSPRDRAHVLLARAVVHVRSGELREGRQMLYEAWEGLAGWNRMAQQLSIETALEAGDASKLDAWLAEAAMDPVRKQIDAAWADLVRGDVMTALEALAELPQEDPWVGLVQALALVEQGRHLEAGPWLDRTERLLPGRKDVEVARARVELRVANPELALRKLRALAEEEPWAPRAYTGLGEAYLLQYRPAVAPGTAEDAAAKSRDHLRDAERAFEKAIAREWVAAEARLQLADVIRIQHERDPGVERKALELLEEAAHENPYLPRYREHLGLLLADLGYETRAMAALSELVDERGVTAAVPLRLIELDVATAAKAVDYDALFAAAETLNGDPRAITRERARVAMAGEGKDELARAQSMLLALLDGYPADTASRVLYAMTHLRQYDRKSAEAALRKGLGVTPQGDRGRLYLAWAQLEARVGKSRVAASRARSAWIRMLAEDRPPVELLEAADLATRLWTREGNDRVSVAIARELTERLDYQDEAWTIRARAELGANDTTAARDSAEKATEIDDANAEAHVILGHCLLRFGYKDKAREQYERAVALAAGSPLEKEYRENLRRL